jgi:hypothetical protein
VYELEYMKKIFLLPLLLIAAIVSAQTEDFSSSEFSYLFHVYYEGGRLSLDRDFRYPYDVVASPADEGAGPFKADIINFLGQVQTSATFNLEEGNADISIPFVANAKEIYFYNADGIRLLSVDLSGSSFCNDDKVCNQDVGENFRACPNDCEAVNLPVPTSEAENPTQATTPSKPLLPIIVIAGILIGLAIIFYRFWINKKHL